MYAFVGGYANRNHLFLFHFGIISDLDCSYQRAIPPEVCGWRYVTRWLLIAIQQMIYSMQLSTLVLCHPGMTTRISPPL